MIRADSNKLIACAIVILLLGVGIFTGCVTDGLSPYREYFLLLIVLNGLLSIFLIPLAGRQSWGYLPLWFVYGFFVFGYWLQMFWMLLDPDDFAAIHWSLPSLAVDPRNVVAAFATSTVGFFGSCLAALGCVILPRCRRRVVEPASEPTEIQQRWRRGQRTLAWMMFGVTCLSMVITSSTMAMTGVAVMGAESVYLPFRLAGVIFYSHSVIIPIFLAALVLVCERIGRGYFTAAMMLVFMHGASGVVLRSSRGALLYVFAIVFFTLIASGRLTRSRLTVFLIVGIFVGLMYPFVTMYRQFRAGMGHGTEAWDLLVNVWEGSWGVTSAWGLFLGTAKSLILRLNGLTSLLPIVSSELAPARGNPWDLVVGGEGLTRYFTWEILQYPQDIPHSTAPTWLGWMYLLFGNGGVAIGAIAVTSLALVVWRMIERSSLRTKSVAQAAGIVFFTMVLTEGTFERLWLDFVAIALGVAVCEIFQHTVGKCVYARLSIVPRGQPLQAPGGYEPGA